jgi:hypothetical protein
MPLVFATYNPNFAGGVIQASKPRVYPFPRVATYTIGPSGHRLQPTERGNFFLRNGANVPAQPAGAVNPSDTPLTQPAPKGGCSCGGCGGAK